MKNVKIILFTIIIFIQSLPTFSVDALDNGLENNGIICYNLEKNVKKDVIGIFFLRDKSYKRFTIKNFDEFYDIKEFESIPIFLSKEANVKYIINTPMTNVIVIRFNPINGV